MKKRLLIILLATLGAAFLWFFGYLTLNSERPIKDSLSKYNSAISDIPFNEDMVLTITENTEISSGNETFISESQKTVAYDYSSNDALQIHSEEALRFGDQTVSITETLTDGLLYTDINDAHFRSNFTEADYLAKALPPTIIDHQLYEKITGIRTGGKYIISFRNPIALERWLTEDIPEDYSAEGKVYIDKNGTLLKSSYTADYTTGNIHHHTTVNVAISKKDVTISQPEINDQYTDIENPEALRALEIACGYLLQAKNISFDYTDEIYVQATGDHRSQIINGNASTVDTLSAKLETYITLTNESRADQRAEYTKVEEYHNDQYTISADGGAPAHNPEVTAKEMYNYIQNQLVSTIMLPQYIASTQVSGSKENTTYTFGGNEAFSKYLTESACQILYQNSQLLEGAAEDITADEFRCYLTVDNNTHFPTASGIIFTGSYKTSGVSYQLKYHTTQNYRIIHIQ